MGEVPLQVKYHPDGPGTEKELVMDFTPPFKRVSMISGLEEVRCSSLYRSLALVLPPFR